VAFEIQFVSSAKRQLRGFDANERVTILEAIEVQLTDEPLAETRNRKRLRQNPIAPWELRIKNVRVFYDVEEPNMVTILAIGTKRRNELYIEGKRIQL
jgi:mRNA-degrading endonuclease RelE of RelBE toxin-antitoxin system